MNNRMGHSDPGPVPDRWLRCPKKACDLIIETFLAFKTPLSHRFDDKVKLQYRFPPKMLIEYTKQKRWRLGLWVDLTNTSRFYDKQEVESGYDDGHTIAHVKVNCRGHKEAPSPDQTLSFIEVCKKFKSKKPLEIIGVHCTHGFNRTGFLIVAFLVEECGWSVKAALQEFSLKRPPGIYKQDYIDELFRRYEPDDLNVPSAPQRPDWCFDDGEESSEYSDSPNQNGKRAHPSHEFRGKKKIKENAQFMEGVPGVELVRDPKLVHEVQSLATRMCGWKDLSFPGAQPVSMDLENIALLKTNRYRVSWKADGTRYMMLIKGPDNVFFLDRDNSVFQVSGLKFLYRKDYNKHLVNTLLDGEMVIDRFQGANIPRFLVYDVVYINDIDAKKFPFHPQRLQIIDADVIHPRTKAMMQGIIRKELEPFSVRAKAFFPLESTESLLGEKFAQQLSHEPDGLIFQPSDEPYLPGQCKTILKWKPPSLNSIDFRLKIVTEQGLGLVTRKVGHLYVGGLHSQFDSMKFKKGLEQYDNKIIECRYENKKWVFMRERTDKSFPNSYNTAVSVFNTIKKPVEKEFLLGFIKKYHNPTDADLMPPPSRS